MGLNEMRHGSPVRRTPSESADLRASVIEQHSDGSGFCPATVMAIVCSLADGHSGYHFDETQSLVWARTTGEPSTTGDFIVAVRGASRDEAAPASHCKAEHDFGGHRLDCTLAEGHEGDHRSPQGGYWWTREGRGDLVRSPLRSDDNCGAPGPMHGQFCVLEAGHDNPHAWPRQMQRLDSSGPAWPTLMRPAVGDGTWPQEVDRALDVIFRQLAELRLRTAGLARIGR